MKNEKKINMKEMGETLKQTKTLPKKVQDEINMKVFRNILLAIIVMLYFYFINLGFFNIKLESYIFDLRVFTVVLMVTAIIIFEVAYKQDSGEIALFGAEIAVLGLTTLTAIYACIGIANKYIYIYTFISYIFAAYFVGKDILIYRKMKKDYLLNEMKDIIKKNK